MSDVAYLKSLLGVHPGFPKEVGWVGMGVCGAVADGCLLL